ncbi:hypothetical protein [Corynebacterium pilbarense]|uniref:hypothetical protein n=1 Tax=Corynebacterium pilbarense TaxID=1288393 RepID=UPI00366E0F2F
MTTKVSAYRQRGRSSRGPALLTRSRRSDDEITPFGRGYLFARGAEPHFVPRGWEHLSICGLDLWHDERLPVENYVSDDFDGAAILIGTAIDSDLHSSDQREICHTLMEAARSGSDFRALDEYVTWLGGRFVILMVNGETLRIYGDATASRSCFWAVTERGLIASSHSTLTARAIDAVATDRSRSFLNHPDYKSPAGKWLPGAMAPHDAVSMITANCVLTVDNHKAKHSRFFPSEGYSPKKRDAIETARQVEEELNRQLELGIDKRKPFYFGLTAGWDSRVFLKATLDRLHELNAIAFTYHSFEKNPTHSRNDLVAASHLAVASDLRFLVMDLKPSDKSSRFRKAYAKTFTGWARFPALAENFYNELDHDGQVAILLGPEVGTVFYRERDPSLLNARGLAAKFTQSSFAENAELVCYLDSYIDYTQLDMSEHAIFHPFDLFYWESRLSSWAAGGYAEYEMAADVILPFNTRRILVPMLEQSFEERLSKRVYKIILDKIDQQ